MSDLISRHEALKGYQSVCKGITCYECRAKDADGTCRLESFINNLPSADRPHWIPVTERLPEEREWIGTEKFGTTISDKVLVTFESRGERFVKPMKFQNGELGGMDKHTMDAFYDEWEAIAWMPLPEAYREDGEEE